MTINPAVDEGSQPGRFAKCTPPRKRRRRGNGDSSGKPSRSYPKSPPDQSSALDQPCRHVLGYTGARHDRRQPPLDPRPPRMVHKPRPGELVWAFRKAHDTYACKLHYDGEYGSRRRSSRTAICSPGSDRSPEPSLCSGPTRSRRPLKTTGASDEPEEDQGV